VVSGRYWSSTLEIKTSGLELTLKKPGKLTRAIRSRLRMGATRLAAIAVVVAQQFPREFAVAAGRLVAPL
jgi:hypothetical protein